LFVHLQQADARSTFQRLYNVRLVHFAQCRVHLPSVCAHYGWRFLEARVTGIRAAAREIDVLLPDSSTQCIVFDIASIDVGSRTRVPFDVSGVDPGRCILTRPIALLPAKIGAFLTANAASPRIAVVGGGCAGIELSFTILSRAERLGVKAPHVTLIDSAELLAASQGPMVHKHVLAEAKKRHIAIRTGVRVVEVGSDGRSLVLSDGAVIPFDCIVLATGPEAWPFQAQGTDLACDTQGYIRVRSTLQTTFHDHIFACGDCASFDEYDGAFPPKAGVYAVRESPILTANITTALRGTGTAYLSLYLSVCVSVCLSLSSLLLPLQVRCKHTYHRRSFCPFLRWATDARLGRSGA
jgi:selenide,water dikinase